MSNIELIWIIWGIIATGIIFLLEFIKSRATRRLIGLLESTHREIWDELSRGKTYDLSGSNAQDILRFLARIWPRRVGIPAVFAVLKRIEKESEKNPVVAKNVQDIRRLEIAEVVITSAIIILTIGFAASQVLR